MKMKIHTFFLIPLLCLGLWAAPPAQATDDGSDSEVTYAPSDIYALDFGPMLEARQSLLPALRSISLKDPAIRPHLKKFLEHLGEVRLLDTPHYFGVNDSEGENLKSIKEAYLAYYKKGHMKSEMRRLISYILQKEVVETIVACNVDARWFDDIGGGKLSDTMLSDYDKKMEKALREVESGPTITLADSTSNDREKRISKELDRIIKKNGLDLYIASGNRKIAPHFHNQMLLLQIYTAMVKSDAPLLDTLLHETERRTEKLIALQKTAEAQARKKAGPVDWEMECLHFENSDVLYTIMGLDGAILGQILQTAGEGYAVADTLLHPKGHFGFQAMLPSHHPTVYAYDDTPAKGASRALDDLIKKITRKIHLIN